MKFFKNFFYGAVLLAGLSAGCSNSYVRSLEKIVIENQGTVNIRKNESLHNDKILIPFDYSKKYLITENNAGINVCIYSSQKPSANIILLSTLGEPAHSLDKFSREMAGYGYNIYALDIEGFGKSSGERGKIDLLSIKEDISALIEYIKSRNEKKIVLAGTSMGSEISLLYSAEGKYRDWISAVIAQGSFVPSAKISDLDIRVGFCKNPLNRLLVEIVSCGKLDMLNILGKNNFYNNSDDLKQVTQDRDYHLSINTHSYLEFLSYKPKNPITSFERPILFVVSKNDGMIPFEHSIKVYDCFRETNKNAVLYIPKGEERGGEVPHMAFDTNPKEISMQINSFLRSLK